MASLTAQTIASPELVPEAYRQAVLLTAAGTDVEAGGLSGDPWPWRGVATQGRVWPDAMTSLGGDDVLIFQDLAPKDQRFVRLHASGRLSRPMGSGTWPGEYGSEVEAGPDGRLVLLARGAVWQVGTDGRASVLTRGKPAANGLDPISGVAPLAAGDTLVADATRNQIVRLASAGSRTVVAGTGRAGLSGDGGLAVAATIGPLGRIAAFADGSFLLAQRDAGEAWLVRRVDPAGVIATAAGGGPSASDDRCRSDSVPASSVWFHEINDLVALPAGDFLLVDRYVGVFHVSLAGQLTQIVCASPGPAERRHDTNLDGRRADEVILDNPTSVALTNDRTLLIGAGSPDGDYVAMLSPDGRRLGVALTPDTLATIARGRLVIAATHAATVDVRLVHGDKTVSKITATVPPGRTVLHLHHRVPPGEDTVLVAARTSDARVAADRLRTIVPGPLGLGVAIARRLIFRQLDRQANTVDPKLERCRAISRQAVTCRLRDDSADLPGGIRQRWTIRRTSDGVIRTTVSGEGSFVIQP